MNTFAGGHPTTTTSAASGDVRTKLPVLGPPGQLGLSLSRLPIPPPPPLFLASLLGAGWQQLCAHGTRMACAWHTPDDGRLPAAPAPAPTRPCGRFYWLPLGGTSPPLRPTVRPMRPSAARLPQRRPRAGGRARRGGGVGRAVRWWGNLMRPGCPCGSRCAPRSSNLKCAADGKRCGGTCVPSAHRKANQKCCPPPPPSRPTRTQ